MCKSDVIEILQVSQSKMVPLSLRPICSQYTVVTKLSFIWSSGPIGYVGRGDSHTNPWAYTKLTFL